MFYPDERTTKAMNGKRRGKDETVKEEGKKREKATTQAECRRSFVRSCSRRRSSDRSSRSSLEYHHQSNGEIRGVIHLECSGEETWKDSEPGLVSQFRRRRRRLLEEKALSVNRAPRAWCSFVLVFSPLLSSPFSRRLRVRSAERPVAASEGTSLEREATDLPSSGASCCAHCDSYR